MIPQKAVNDIQGTYNVYVVKSDDTVEIRKVEIGDTYGTDWVITKGLSEGERIIVEGFQKVRSGMKVNPKVKKSPKDPADEKPKAQSETQPR